MLHLGNKVREMVIEGRKPPDIYLFRIGIDMGMGGGLAPIYNDNSFEYIPVPSNEGNWTTEARTYKNTFTKRERAPFANFVGNKYKQRKIEWDPATKGTEILSYGERNGEEKYYDNGKGKWVAYRRARNEGELKGDKVKGLFNLPVGGWLVAWSGLINGEKGKMYIIGYLEKERAEWLGDLTLDQVEERISEIDRKDPDLVNAHLKNIAYFYLKVRNPQNDQRIIKEYFPLAREWAPLFNEYLLIKEKYFNKPTVTIPEKWENLFTQFRTEFEAIFYLDFYLDCAILHGNGCLLSKAWLISDEKRNLLPEYIEKWQWKLLEGKQTYSLIRSAAYRKFSQNSFDKEHAIDAFINEMQSYL